MSNETNKKVRGRRWLNSKETAEYLDKSLYTLQRWRSNGIGPRWGKNGHSIFYFLDDVDDYLESTLVPDTLGPTSKMSGLITEVQAIKEGR